MVSRETNDKFDLRQLKELNFHCPKHSENYDDPQLPLIKSIINCTRNHVITSANCYRDYQGLFQAMHEITDVYLRGKNEHGFKQHGVKHTDQWKSFDRFHTQRRIKNPFINYFQKSIIILFVPTQIPSTPPRSLF